MRKRASFERRLRDALASPQLRLALDRAMPSLRERRARALSGKFEGLRARATEVRDRSVRSLPELVQRFSEAARAAGATVHTAADASEACRIVAEICQRAGARLVVKSKSMATEEIELNPFLESRGIKVVETDLGEWIVQLAGETPSHFLAPAIHKTREQVAELLARETGQQVPQDDIGEMVRVARKYLRKAFIEADVGISGANLAIAESGTVVVVTNEGNDRLVTTLPPIHVVVVGMEKIVETLEDAVAVLRVLAPSATGQLQTSYVSFITGPSRTADIESALTVGAHGPAEVHIVLLDNGRTEAWSSPETQPVLRCIRCSACVSVCPPYQVVGGHAFGYIYNGPVGLILTAIHHGLEHAGGPQSLCAGCNACATVCPVSIPLPDLILDLRKKWTERKGLPLGKRIAIAAMASPSRLRLWSAALAKVQKPFLGPSGMIERFPFGKLVEDRYLPSLSPFRLSKMAVPDPPASGSIERTLEGLTVGYFPGCVTSYSLTSIGIAAISLLKAMGAHVVLAAPDRCCGLPSLNAGDFRTARQMALGLLEELSQVKADLLVTTSASCFSCITQDYLKVLGQDEFSKLEGIRPIFQDMTRFLTKYLRASLASGTAKVPGIITYHDACQSYNVLGLYREPRDLLHDTLKAEVIEMAESSRCCGFGGTFSLEHPEVARHLLKAKIRCVADTGATVVVADNPGCIAHLRGGLKAHGLPVEVKHLVEVLAETLLQA
jgi:L-lactate dehydrogenase complex protein LldF